MTLNFFSTYGSLLLSFMGNNIIFFRSLKFQFLLLMAFSIALPFVFNFIVIVPEISRLGFKKFKNFFLSSILSPFSPALVLYFRCRLTTLQELQRFEFWTKRESRISLEHDDDSTSNIIDYTNQIRQLEIVSAKLRKNENAFEHFTQTVLLMIVILLKYTTTPTKSVLQELFAGGSMHLIVLSAIWSFSSLVVGFLQWVTLNKGNFLPIIGRVILASFAVLSLIARMSSVVLYFAPSLGLMNLLGHYQMGTLPTSKDIKAYESNISFTDAWNEFRIEDFMSLTTFSLEVYYIVFLFLVFLHYLCLTLVKYFAAIGFKGRSDLTKKIFHILTQLVFPVNYKDWDDLDDCNILENFSKVCFEKKLLVALFAVEHLVLCVPMFILSSNIGRRNSKMENFFPQVMEEKTSTSVAYSLSVFFPIFYCLLPFAQYYIFLAYNKFGHPWSKILNSQIKKSGIGGANDGSQSCLNE